MQYQFEVVIEKHHQAISLWVIVFSMVTLSSQLFTTAVHRSDVNCISLSEEICDGTPNNAIQLAMRAQAQERLLYQQEELLQATD